MKSSLSEPDLKASAASVAGWGAESAGFSTYKFWYADVQMEGGEPVAQGSRHEIVKAQSSWSYLHYGLLDNSAEPKPRDPNSPHCVMEAQPASFYIPSLSQRLLQACGLQGGLRSPVTLGGVLGEFHGTPACTTLTTTVKPGDLRARDFRRLVPRALASQPAAWEHWSLLSGRCAGVEPTVEPLGTTSRHLSQG